MISVSGMSCAGVSWAWLLENTTSDNPQKALLSPFGVLISKQIPAST